jgi:hypothetical protein
MTGETQSTTVRAAPMMPEGANRTRTPWCIHDRGKCTASAAYSAPYRLGLEICTVPGEPGKRPQSRVSPVPQDPLPPFPRPKGTLRAPQPTRIPRRPRQKRNPARDPPTLRRRSRPAPEETDGHGKRKPYPASSCLPAASTDADRTLRRAPHLADEPLPRLRGEPQHRASPRLLSVADKHAATVANDLDTVPLGRVAGLNPP